MQQRRTILHTALAVLTLTAPAWGVAAPARPGAAPRIAVTDLAYAQRVSEYFVAGTYQHSSQMSAGGSHSGSYSHGPQGGSGAHTGSHSMQASEQASGTYVAGRYSYIEQRELGGYTNDIKGALLQGSYFRLVQGKGFDAGRPQPSKAEQVLNQVQGGKMAQPQAQPQVADVIARIKKGEFNGADHVLFGVVSSVEFTDALSPLQGSSSATRQYGLQLLADFSLIDTKTYEIKAAFSAQGEGNDTKILSIRGDIAPPNRAKVMRETSLSLAQSVYQQLATQLGYTDAHLARGLRPPPAVPPQAGQPMPQPVESAPPPQAPEQVLILK
ncbi:hypothetical protein [Verminephrobacter aporrectodeae]|uniref:hypothetical protein n=1 Tax=Verminephrobacter aporrectodeae TaxID=1110389 RepID=UPI002238C187|nr:hypothetical protein [Verminephrobacter aporrectodeae]MCW5220992.1 hypothetical protein [Verminephrobacter aporrectodeae subsp. tuberculatae]MCW5290285.1 hypothetical protein [Verminephrobacter aporrectodeae subsp. tuberculatae]MCW8165996.1 hypothetical protein [Verminephrobacter aporrectodeae subsp. tuberculatae]MCW8170641.1 hypothetical protein [Verminephrobacter aporrectodeae subsp. tuberculatae]MCW8176431.1 hypothetical protein [Verminephrobacter aporrectodeae subsp. tuberculatae]